MTQDQFNELKKLYIKAIKDKKNCFEFNGQLLLTFYAGYMVEYYRTKFPRIS